MKYKISLVLYARHWQLEKGYIRMALVDPGREVCTAVLSKAEVPSTQCSIFVTGDQCEVHLLVQWNQKAINQTISIYECLTVPQGNLYQPPVKRLCTTKTSPKRLLLNNREQRRTTTAWYTYFRYCSEWGRWVGRLSTRSPCAPNRNQLQTVEKTDKEVH